MTDRLSGPNSVETTAPIGVVLAGGAGRRIGGDKALMELAGRPLISYPLGALQAALDDVAVVVKPGTRLPALEGVVVWQEPSEPRHPAVGILEALRRAEGRSVVVCACDMPLLDAALIRSLSQTPADGALAVLATAGSDGEALEPLLARYEPAALRVIQEALCDDPRIPMRTLAAALAPRRCPVAAAMLTNVNTPEDIARLEALIRR